VTPLCDGVTLITLAGAALLAGAVLLRLFLPAPSPFPGRQVVAEVARMLPSARAEVLDARRSLPCDPFDGSRLQCPGPEWNFAGEVILGADHMLRQCIWLHPIQGAKLTLHFDDVPLGEALEGFFGMADAVVDPPSPHGTRLHVLLDGQPLQTFDCPTRRGWFPWKIDTPGRTGTRGRVTFQSEAGFTGRRHFCFTGFSTRPTE
jgi:hypothetical protein